MNLEQKLKRLTSQLGFSLTELMVVLVIIGVLVLLALPKLLPIVNKAKTTEAKLMLKQVYTLEQSYKFEHDRYSATLSETGFEQDNLISKGGHIEYNRREDARRRKGKIFSIAFSLLSAFRSPPGVESDG